MIIKLDEADILQRTKSESNSQLLKCAFEDSRPELLKLVSKRVGSKMGRRVNPSDVLQEAYIAATKKLDKYFEDPRVPLLQWIQSICFQSVSVLYKQHFVAKKRSVLVEDHQDENSYYSTAFLDSASSPSARLIRGEEQEQVFALVSKMAEVDQAILYLRYVEGISNREAAARLGVEVETAKKRHVRALKRLTKLAAESGKAATL
jgi:RNA polymerase sigma-70 factor (ECF subfamily)